MKNLITRPIITCRESVPSGFTSLVVSVSVSASIAGVVSAPSGVVDPTGGVGAPVAAWQVAVARSQLFDTQLLYRKQPVAPLANLFTQDVVPSPAIRQYLLLGQSVSAVQTSVGVGVVAASHSLDSGLQLFDWHSKFSKQFKLPPVIIFGSHSFSTPQNKPASQFPFPGPPVQAFPALT